MIRSATSVLALCAAVLLAACGTSGAGIVERDALAPTAPAGRDDGVFDVVVGDCFLRPGTGEAAEHDVVLDEVEIVACDQPHHNEVFHAFDLADGPFPGLDEVTRSAETGCAGPFTAFVGPEVPSPDLAIYLLYPTERSWAEGDREVTCTVFDQRGVPLTGSVAADPGSITRGEPVG